MTGETQGKLFLVSLRFCAAIWFNKSRIKSSVRDSERRPPSQTNAVTTLASQSLNVCKYCNKQQGFPHKKCSSSTGTDRRYGPWLQDEECCLSLLFSFLLWFFKEIANLRCRQGRALLEVSVRSPNSPGCYSASASPLNPRPGEPFKRIDFLRRCNIHYGLQYIMLSVCWKCRHSVTFLGYVCS